jgi:hypothetical protein
LFFSELSNPLIKYQIEFKIPLKRVSEEGVSVRLVIYNILGKSYRLLPPLWEDGRAYPGFHSVEWDASSYSGVLLPPKAAEFTQTGNGIGEINRKF